MTTLKSEIVDDSNIPRVCFPPIAVIDKASTRGESIPTRIDDKQVRGWLAITAVAEGGSKR